MNRMFNQMYVGKIYGIMINNPIMIKCNPRFKHVPHLRIEIHLMVIYYSRHKTLYYCYAYFIYNVFFA